MLFSPRIHLSKEIHTLGLERSRQLGYASLEEYLTHLIEKDLSALTPEEDAAVENRLKGLGYL